MSAEMGTAVEAVDVRPAARAIVDAVHDGAITKVMDCVDQMDRAELVSIIVMLASVIEVGDPLQPREAANVTRATSRIITAAGGMVCALYNIETGELFGPGSRRPATNARHVLCAVASWSGVPVAEIGRVIGRHHTTVMNSVDRVENSPELASQAHRIMHRINDGRLRP